MNDGIYRMECAVTGCVGYGDTVVWVPAKNPPVEEKLPTTRLRGGVTLQEKEYE
jgi:hypothetical protein